MPEYKFPSSFLNLFSVLRGSSLLNRVLGALESHVQGKRGAAIGQSVRMGVPVLAMGFPYPWEGSAI